MGDGRYFKKDPDTGMNLLSPSQVTTILNCPRKWRAKVVDKLPDPPGIDSKLGNIVHDALDSSMVRKMKGEETTTRDVAQEAYDAGLLFFGDANLVKELRPSDAVEALAEQDVLAKKAGDLASVAWEWLNTSGLTPVGTELKLERVITYKDIQVKLNGRLDLLAKNRAGKHVIVDYKTTKRAPSVKNGGGFAMERGHLLQQLLYVYMLQGLDIEVEEVGTLKLTKTKKPGAYYSGVKVTQGLLEWAEETTIGAIKTIYNGDFEPNPIGAGFLCHPVYCPAYHVCPGGKARTASEGDPTAEAE